MKKKAIVILSGGMDSSTLLYDMHRQGHELKALSIDYGQRHSRELDCAKALCEMLQIEHKVADLSALKGLLPGSALTDDAVDVPEGHYADENMRLTVVPNRNMLMLAVAGAWAASLKYNTIAYGAHSGDHAIYPDCRPEFVSAMVESLKLCDWQQLSLYAPYLDIDKGAIAKLGTKLGVPYELTWTCYKGGERACGKCGSCTERLEAFAAAGVTDPLEYDDA